MVNVTAMRHTIWEIEVTMKSVFGYSINTDKTLT